MAGINELSGVLSKNGFQLEPFLMISPKLEDSNEYMNLIKGILKSTGKQKLMELKTSLKGVKMPLYFIGDIIPSLDFQYFKDYLDPRSIRQNVFQEKMLEGKNPLHIEGTTVFFGFQKKGNRLMLSIPRVLSLALALYSYVTPILILFTLGEAEGVSSISKEDLNETWGKEKDFEKLTFKDVEVINFIHNFGGKFDDSKNEAPMIRLLEAIKEGTKGIIPVKTSGPQLPQEGKKTIIPSSFENLSPEYKPIPWKPWNKKLFPAFFIGSFPSSLDFGYFSTFLDIRTYSLKDANDMIVQGRIPSVEKNLVFFGFNDTGSRFQQAIPTELVYLVAFFTKKTRVIIDLKVAASSASAYAEAPQKLSSSDFDRWTTTPLFQGLEEFNQVRVITFWYDMDFKFTAQPNSDSKEILEKIIEKALD